jgi:hypothetical protein
MTCASFGSSNDVSLFYAIDPDPAAIMPAATVWKPVPFTSESLDNALSVSMSEQVRDTAEYTTSKTTQGSVSGNISFEVFAGSFVENMLIAALRADTDLHITEDTRTWDDAGTIRNGKKVHCFAFLKRIRRASGNYDFFLFRGVQIASLSLNMDSGSVVTGDVSIMGTGIGDGSTLVYKDIADGTAPIDVAGWTFEAYPESELMDSGKNFANFIIYNSAAADTGIVAQSVSVSLDNSLREQFAVGEGKLYPAGVGSGRLNSTLSISAYYADPTLFEALQTDENLSITFDLKDDTTKGFAFEFPKVRVSSGANPQAGGNDSDLMLSSEFQAYGDVTDGTVRVTLDTTAT